MDLPILLEQMDYHEGWAEVKQTLEVLFKNEIRSFNQAALTGSAAPVHTDMDYISADLYIRDVISQVRGVELVDMKLSSKLVNNEQIGTIELQLSYVDNLYKMTLEGDSWK